MTDTSQLKQQANYHEQPDLPCCDNCMYVEENAAGLTCMAFHYARISPVGICKHYSQWWKKPEAHK